MISIDPARIRHLLISANNRIGDVVMISPAVRAIREHFSAARIAILGSSWVVDASRGKRRLRLEGISLFALPPEIFPRVFPLFRRPTVLPRGNWRR
jgi:hypothetical protein